MSLNPLSPNRNANHHLPPLSNNPLSKDAEADSEDPSDAAESAPPPTALAAANSSHSASSNGINTSLSSVAPHWDRGTVAPPSGRSSDSQGILLGSSQHANPNKSFFPSKAKPNAAAAGGGWWPPIRADR
ncbi:hypothetical protein STCU_11297 [Strigomonas culicis]|uniref:Uncharacterized protein n=1 Tax=Strigomonas culicis TaxID=28005 RepID=S9V0S5_9TRYP|nr:hypothetical protein STCU_11297 [Strigomonas culicis]|eukprot:EPY16415.1 hypothetical protein STCU_11297 [Strigomonas culicis]